MAQTLLDSEYARRAVGEEGRLGSDRCGATHAALLEAVRQLVGPASTVERDHSGGCVTGSATAWWRLPEISGCGYLWENLLHHLEAAGEELELDRVCCDLRFLAVRLLRADPATVESDLALSASPIAYQLSRQRHRRCPAFTGCRATPLCCTASGVSTLQEGGERRGRRSSPLAARR